MLKEEEKGLIPCGIPYVLHDLNDVDKNAMGPTPFIEAGGEVLVDPVISIDFETKTLKTRSEAEYAYDKLVFATAPVSAMMGNSISTPMFSLIHSSHLM